MLIKEKECEKLSSRVSPRRSKNVKKCNFHIFNAKDTETENSHVALFAVRVYTEGLFHTQSRNLCAERERKKDTKQNRKKNSADQEKKE